MSYFKVKMHHIQFRLGLHPRPCAGRAHSAAPYSVAGFKGSYFERNWRGGRTGVRTRGNGFFFIFNHSWAPKRSWKISHGVLESAGKVLDFFVSKRVGTLHFVSGCFIWCSLLHVRTLLVSFTDLHTQIILSGLHWLSNANPVPFYTKISADHVSAIL